MIKHWPNRMDAQQEIQKLRRKIHEALEQKNSTTSELQELQQQLIKSREQERLCVERLPPDYSSSFRSNLTVVDELRSIQTKSGDTEEQIKESKAELRFLRQDLTKLRDLECEWIKRAAVGKPAVAAAGGSGGGKTSLRFSPGVGQAGGIHKQGDKAWSQSDDAKRKDNAVDLTSDSHNAGGQGSSSSSSSSSSSNAGNGRGRKRDWRKQESDDDTEAEMDLQDGSSNKPLQRPSSSEFSSSGANGASDKYHDETDVEYRSTREEDDEDEEEQEEDDDSEPKECKKRNQTKKAGSKRKINTNKAGSAAAASKQPAKKSRQERPRSSSSSSSSSSIANARHEERDDAMLRQSPRLQQQPQPQQSQPQPVATILNDEVISITIKSCNGDPLNIKVNNQLVSSP